MANQQVSNKNFLRTVALTVTVIGTIGSLYFMFNAGRNQNSIILLGLFTGWVLSPFVGLFITNKISKRLAIRSQTLLHWSMIVLTICSLIAYSGVFNTAQTKNAFMFLVVPLISWLLLIIVIFISRKSYT